MSEVVAMHVIGLRCLIIALILAGAGWNARAASPEAAEQVSAGNRAYADGDYAAALAHYERAEVHCPECPELAYDRGLAHYRLRDFVKARAQLNAALATRDLGLEARAKYNLGNVAYAQALEKLNAPQEAIELARRAIDRYRDALELDPADDDARANIEIAQLLIKDLLDKLKNEQENQQQNEQQQDEQQQDQQDPQDQDPAQENQQDKQQKDSDQQDQNQQQDAQDPNSSDQSQSGDQQPQQQGDEQQQEQSQQEQQAGEEKSKQDEGEAQKQQQSAAQDEAQEQPPEDESTGQAEGRPVQLTDEQVERMLQAVRDREAQRREDRAKRRNARAVPVARDW
jgi:Ca-activated chloride channel family protein